MSPHPRGLCVPRCPGFSLGTLCLRARPPGDVLLAWPRAQDRGCCPIGERRQPLPLAEGLFAVPAGSSLVTPWLTTMPQRGRWAAVLSTCPTIQVRPAAGPVVCGRWEQCGPRVFALLLLLHALPPLPLLAPGSPPPQPVCSSVQALTTRVFCASWCSPTAACCAPSSRGGPPWTASSPTPAATRRRRSRSGTSTPPPPSWGPSTARSAPAAGPGLSWHTPGLLPCLPCPYLPPACAGPAWSLV